MQTLRLSEDPLTLASARQVLEGPVRVELDDGLLARVAASEEAVRAIVVKGDAAYGINTGFGLLAKKRIADDELTLLQRNLVLSHSTGVGEPLDDAIVRLILVLKIAALARGYSGISRTVIEALQRLLEHEIYPIVPSKGSVGASGDLAPLAHMSAVLLGEGKARQHGEELGATEALARAGMKPIELGPKEGLALLNGTQVSTALALAGLFAAEDLFAAAMVAGMLSVDAAKGSDTPFDPRIHQLRGQTGQIRVAQTYLRLLEGSTIRASHLNCDKVQDPYSLRCQPQVMGACLDMMDFAATLLQREAGAVTDNPLVFSETTEVLSGGNFHAEPVAMAADVLAIAIAEIGALSERRIALLIDKHLSGLENFLVENGGVNSGFMIAQVTAAALASENKSLAHPASVDSLPTSANQEDHVSMATFAARRLLDMAANSRGVVAIELLAAAQGIDFHHRADSDLRSSEPLERVHARIRDKVAFYDCDRYFAPDIEAVQDLITAGVFRDEVGELLPSAR